MKRNYTFIVGAGASFEFGFPTGNELKNRISSRLGFNENHFGDSRFQDTVLNRAVTTLKQSLKKPDLEHVDWIAAADAISRNMGLSFSIDNYLETTKDLPGYGELGKLAISSEILNSERNSPLWLGDHPNVNQHADFARFKSNWLSNLFQILSAQKGFDEFRAALHSFKFVTFNYDRVIERFFHLATKSYFSLDEGETKDALQDALNVVHVFGSLGDIYENVTDFGETQYDRCLLDAMRSIKTFTEGIQKPEQVDKAKSWLASSDVIVFLGFGFLPLNMDALRPQKALGDKEVYGTAYGMSDDNLNISKNILLHRWFGGIDIKRDFRNVECHRLISDLSGVFSENDII